jgi:hypothetical protein
MIGALIDVVAGLLPPKILAAILVIAVIAIGVLIWIIN